MRRRIRIYVQNIQFMGCLAFNIKRRGGRRIDLGDAFCACGQLDKDLREKHNATLEISREDLLDIAYRYPKFFTVSEDEIININDNIKYQDFKDHLAGNTLPDDIFDEMNKAFNKLAI